MRPKSTTAALIAVIAFAYAGAPGQDTKTADGKTEKAAARMAYFIDPTLLDLSLILPPPPSRNSDTTKKDLAEVHRVEKQRTAQQIAAAKADDQEQDIFIFKDVMGESFTEANLPITAAFSAHIHNEEGVASTPLKTSFARSRPYQADNTLHPVCKVTTEPNSYPSGHTLSGYLLAFALVQMVPEKHEQIMKRADEYASNRIVCGVHYPSDIEASQRVAYAVFGYLLGNPRFQKELASARTETRLRLGLPSASTTKN